MLSAELTAYRERERSLKTQVNQLSYFVYKYDNNRIFPSRKEAPRCVEKISICRM